MGFYFCTAALQRQCVCHDFQKIITQIGLKINRDESKIIVWIIDYLLAHGSKSCNLQGEILENI